MASPFAGHANIRSDTARRLPPRAVPLPIQLVGLPRNRGATMLTKAFVVLASLFCALVPVPALCGPLDLPAPRVEHTATRLRDGSILVAGGTTSDPLTLASRQTATALRWDPFASAWIPTSNMVVARSLHTAVLLNDGRVLVAGGYNGELGEHLAAAEVFDPVTKVWSSVGAMADRRFGHTMTVLESGEVLVTGGYVLDATGSAASTRAEIFNPNSGSWRPAAPMSDTRALHQASLLPGGYVLVTGGSASQVHGASSYSLATAELFDPATGAWTSVDSMQLERTRHASHVLPSGRVVVFGGYSSAVGWCTGVPADTYSELFDPATRTWEPGPPLPECSAAWRATGDETTAGGDLLVSGTQSPNEDGSGRTYVFSEQTGWTRGPDLLVPTDGHSASSLPDGSLLMVGGVIGSTATNAVQFLTIDFVGVRPVVSAVPDTAMAGLSLSLTGTSFVSGTSAGPTKVVLARADQGPVYVLDPASLGSTGLTATVPATAVAGTYFLRVVTPDGPSLAHPLLLLRPIEVIPASARVPAGSSLQLRTLGGTGSGTIWSMLHNNSGGNVSSAGLYTPGDRTGVTDTVQASDSGGNIASASLFVLPAIVVTPSPASAPPRGSLTLTASGGDGGPYSWSLVTNLSGGTIDLLTGVFRAGDSANRVDRVQVTDGSGSISTFDVAVGPALAVLPSRVLVKAGEIVHLQASGGSGTGLLWTFARNDSNGTIDAATGTYTAGTIEGVIDAVQVVDDLGNVATGEIVISKPSAAGCATTGASGEVLALLGVFGIWLRRRRPS